VTIEMGFKAIGKGVKAPGKGLKKVFNEMRYPSQPYGLRVGTRDVIKGLIKTIVFCGFLGFLLWIANEMKNNLPWLIT
jgi:hypothetical protein